MSSHRKTETLEVMIPTSQTAALASMASQRGINTVSMAASILCAAIDAHPDLKKTPESGNCMIPSTLPGNRQKDGANGTESNDNQPPSRRVPTKDAIRKS
jgi:hypothetical protein